MFECDINHIPHQCINQIHASYNIKPTEQPKQAPCTDGIERSCDSGMGTEGSTLLPERKISARPAVATPP
jgi:hypothetical protein